MFGPCRRSLRRSYFLFALGGSLIVTMLPTESRAAEPVATAGGMTEYLFPNGARLLLVPDASRPTITVNMTVFCGSRHEGYGEAGMAHLLEHMVFKGTPTHPNVPAALQARGARFNGTTWVDRTNYFETLPATEENLEFALRLEADRLVNSLIRAEDLASEMTVVRSEFERGENSPQRVLGQRLLSAAYEWHNYGKSTIGNQSDIERVPVENLREFYRRFYQPDNILVIVAGRFDPARALELAGQTFGAIPRPERKLNTTYTEEPPQDGERRVELRRVGNVALVAVGYHIPAGPHPEFAAVEVLENLLTSVPSGRLYKALVETRKASSVNGAAFAWHDPGYMRFMAQVNTDNDPQVVLDALIAGLDGAVAEPPTAREVERSKVQVLKPRELAMADTSSLAVELSDWAAQGDWRLYFVHQERINAVTPADVHAAAKKYLTANNRTVGLFLPTKSPERVAIPSTPPLAEMFRGYKGPGELAEGEDFDVAPSAIEARTVRTVIAPGMKAALLPKKTRGEVVEVRLLVRYGTAQTLVPYATAAEFLPLLMTRGTKSLSREELQDELDINRVRLTASGAPGVAVFTMQTKRKYLPEALKLLRQVLREPRLDPAELELSRRRALSQIEESLSDPRALAERTLSRALNADYPPNDVRYVPTLEEELARTKELAIDDLRRLYERFFNAQHGQLAVVGDFDPAEIQPILQESLAGWTSPEPFARISQPFTSAGTGEKTVIRTPDKPNAVYAAGLMIPISDSDPDFPALVIGNYILGAGALSSRLGDRIRQREGLSYGVSSSFSADAFDVRGSLTISAICNPKNMARVEQCVKEEIDRLLQEGITEAELKKAIDGYLQRQQVSRTDDGLLAQYLTSTLYADRTLAFYEELEGQIQRLTPETVVKALRTRAFPNPLTQVQAGDFAAP